MKVMKVTYTTKRVVVVVVWPASQPAQKESLSEEKEKVVFHLMPKKLLELAIIILGSMKVISMLRF